MEGIEEEVEEEADVMKESLCTLHRQHREDHLVDPQQGDQGQGGLGQSIERGRHKKDSLSFRLSLIHAEIRRGSVDARPGLCSLP